jgi:hypothetical protein
VVSTLHNEPVVFFHVMKCGGTSVRNGLALGLTGQREGAECFELNGEAAKAAAAGKHADNWRFRDGLLAYVLMTEPPPLVMGHFRYRDRFADFLETAHFVTVLRDPVERVVSLYKYRRYKDTIDVPVSMSFDDFISHKRWAKEGHAYIDTFCGRDDLDPRSDEAIAAAVANLRKFAVVGFTDQLAEFARRVGAVVGRPVKMEVTNRSPAPDGERDVTAASREHAREVCDPDVRVYEQLCRDANVMA